MAEKAQVWTGIWRIILSLYDALLGLTWENDIYGSVVIAEIDFINYRHGSVVFLLLEKKDSGKSESIQKRAITIIQKLKKRPYRDTYLISLSYKKKRLKGIFIIVYKYLPMEKILGLNWFFNLPEKDRHNKSP